MAVISKDLGPVSAYAVAVANGFTGTEAEWEQYIANASTAAQSAAGSATAAASSASAAAQSATAAAASQVAAAGSETEAANYALVAGNHAMAAAASATAAETAETGAETAQAAAEDAQAAAEAVAESIPEDYTALTEEVGSLKSALSKEPISDVNKAFDVVANSQVTSSTGAISYSETASRSDYTDLGNCEYFTLENTYFQNYCLYDGDKTYISGATTTSGNINRPANAKYVIFTCLSTLISSAELHLHNVPTIIGNIYDELDKRASIKTSFGAQYLGDNTLLENVIGVEHFPGNLVVNDECVNNYYVAAGTGNLTQGNNYFCTGYIPVTAGKTYKSNVGRSYAWYKSDKTYLSGENSTGIQTGITAPENAAYIRFTVNKTSDGIITPFDLYFADTDDFVIGTKINDLIVTDVKAWCYEKTINWIGDSIVAGSDFDEVVCSNLGLNKPNEYGIDGSTIALYSSGSDTRNAICERYVDMADNADIIAVSAGTNDWMYAWCPIGTIDDADDGTSNSTFYGAMKALCKGLIDKYPQKVIFFTTPIKRAQAFANGDGGEYTQDGVMTTPFSKNKYGKTLGDYADIIKEVCGYYSIPVLDMYRESMLNPSIEEQQDMFDNVYTHPNATGQKIMARRVCGWLTQLGYKIS